MRYLHVSIFKKSLSCETNDKYDLEHVTPYIRESGKFNVTNYSNKNDYSEQRWTVDWPKDDFELIKDFYKFSPEIFISIGKMF